MADMQVCALGVPWMGRVSIPGRAASVCVCRSECGNVRPVRFLPPHPPVAGQEEDGFLSWAAVLPSDNSPPRRSPRCVVPLG